MLAWTCTRARSRSAAIDGVTGEVFKAGLGPDPAGVLDWMRALPGPVAVAYEAGPTGYGLARAVRAAGVRCEVVAPSKLSRLAGDRVKTNRRPGRDAPGQVAEAG